MFLNLKKKRESPSLYPTHFTDMQQLKGVLRQLMEIRLQIWSCHRGKEFLSADMTNGKWQRSYYINSVYSNHHMQLINL